MKKKILITGASGFVGTNLINALKKDKKFLLFGTYFKNRPKYTKNVKYFQADLTKKKDCFRVLKNIDYVFNCSAITSGASDIQKKPLIHLTPNVIINCSLLESAYENNVKKFIFISSNTVYPLSKKAMKESDAKYNFFEKYFIVGWMKKFSEIMCEMYSLRIKKKMQTIIVRPGNLFGPYDKFDEEKSKVIPALIKKVLESKGEVKVWGDGNDLKDFLYIDDFIDGLIKLLKVSKIFSIYNLAMGKSYKIKKILELILSIEKKKNFNVKYDLTKPTMIPFRNISISKIKSELNWKPKISLKEGLLRTIIWYKRNYNK